MRVVGSMVHTGPFRWPLLPLRQKPDRVLGSAAQAHLHHAAPSPHRLTSGRRSIRLHHNPSCTRVLGLGRAGPFSEWRHVSALAVGGPLTPDPTRLIRLRGSCECDLWPASCCLQHGAFGHHTLNDKAPERHEQFAGHGHDGDAATPAALSSDSFLKPTTLGRVGLVALP